MAIRALAFDVFGTLVDWRSGIAGAFRSCGIADDPEELADAWRARYVPIMLEVNAGRRPWGNFDELHLATLDDVLNERNLTVRDEDRHRLVNGWHRLDPWPDVRSGLEMLRGRFVTAALSNGHTALLVDLARHGDLRFDCLLSAELAHAYKPAPEVYLTAARLLCVDPSELMMVATHPGDLKAARRAGLRSAFLERPLEFGPGSSAREEPDADESIPYLEELAARLEEPA
ncbi:MAG: haloacid dehalogenase type II [Chloroflexota bacterium]|nr:haloacid dehalogenase type II [Chloroflexota bacterium]